MADLHASARRGHRGGQPRRCGSLSHELLHSKRWRAQLGGARCSLGSLGALVGPVRFIATPNPSICWLPQPTLTRNFSRLAQRNENQRHSLLCLGCTYHTRGERPPHISPKLSSHPPGIHAKKTTSNRYRDIWE